MQNQANAVLSEIQKVIIGKDEVIAKVFMAILSGGHVLMEDVPGVGKTTLALAFSRALGLRCQRVQFTSDTMPSDITGFSVYQKAQDAFVYQPGAVMTNLLLADEINRTSSKTQAALLEAMEERQVTVDSVTHPLPEPFIVLATQNPAGSAGTQLLPNSQLDRFMIRLSMGYPDFRSQVEILRDRHTENPLSHIKPVMDAQRLVEVQQEAGRVHIDDAIYEYITRLVQATREHEAVELGVSPRGALAVCRMAKAAAFLKGRDYVVPQDVRSIFPDVCAHRLMMNRRARIAGETGQNVIAGLLCKTEMPPVSEISEAKR
ncbi:MAG: MoxR family ATPase [Clostridiales bacterium]|nr:MoxR family ATPase [Clostridiales bacterium]